MSHRFRLSLVAFGAIALSMQGAAVHAAYNSPWRTDTLQFKKGGGKSKSSSSSTPPSSDSSTTGDSSSTPSDSSSTPAAPADAATPAAPAAPATPPPPPVNTQAIAALQQMYDKLEKEWEATPDVAALIQNQKDAQDAYDAAVQTVSQSVKDELAQNPDYQMAVERQKQLSERVDQFKATNPGAQTDIESATDDLTTASLAVKKMEDDSLSKDETVRQTKIALVKAQLASAEAKDAWEKSLTQNADYMAAKQAASAPAP